MVGVQYVLVLLYIGLTSILRSRSATNIPNKHAAGPSSPGFSLSRSPRRTYDTIRQHHLQGEDGGHGGHGPRKTDRTRRSLVSSHTSRSEPRPYSYLLRALAQALFLLTFRFSSSTTGNAHPACEARAGGRC